MSRNTFVGLVAALLGAALLAGCGDNPVEYSADQEKAIADRIAPSGALAMEGDPIASAPVAVASSSGPRSGEDIYKKTCFTCHAAGVAGAPKTGDAAAWKDRIAQGMDVMVEHAWTGFTGKTGMMPAKGLCMDCSEEEIEAAVKYLVDAIE